MESDLLLVSEIAAALRVSPKNIYYWVGRNEIPFLRIGKALRFRLKDVLEHFETRTEEAKSAIWRDPRPLPTRSLKTRQRKASPSYLVRKLAHKQ